MGTQPAVQPACPAVRYVPCTKTTLCCACCCSTHPPTHIRPSSLQHAVHLAPLSLPTPYHPLSSVPSSYTHAHTRLTRPPHTCSAPMQPHLRGSCLLARPAGPGPGQWLRAAGGLPLPGRGGGAAAAGGGGGGGQGGQGGGAAGAHAGGVQGGWACVWDEGAGRMCIWKGGGQWTCWGACGRRESGGRIAE